MAVELPDPVPLGVSGQVLIPRADYVERVGSGPPGENLLLTEELRVAYLVQRLVEAFERPLTSPGYEQLAWSCLDLFPNADDVLRSFAQKALQTLRDGSNHNPMAVSPGRPGVAIVFSAWNGTHREVQPERYGNYFGPFVALAHKLVESGIDLCGMLEIAAYLRDTPDIDAPELRLDDVFEVDVEFSFLPGALIGLPDGEANPLPGVVVINGDLCSPDERQTLDRLRA